MRLQGRENSKNVKVILEMEVGDGSGGRQAR